MALSKVIANGVWGVFRVLSSLIVWYDRAFPRRPLDKVSTLPIALVEAYRKSHRGNRSSRSITLIVCTNHMFSRFLVPAEKHKKAALLF